MQINFKKKIIFLPIADLVDRTWQVYIVGPLFNCEDSDEFNEKVAERINLEINIRPNPDRKVEVKTIKGIVS